MRRLVLLLLGCGGKPAGTTGPTTTQPDPEPTTPTTETTPTCTATTDPCNGLDDDCDGGIDEDCPPEVRSTADAAGVVVGADGSEAGTSVAIVGDQTGDGVADLLIGAPEDGALREGTAWLVPFAPGATSAPDAAVATIAGDAVGTAFVGSAVADAGDQDADGTPDLWVAGSAASTLYGGVWLFHGPVSGHRVVYGQGDADAFLVAEAFESVLGASIAGGGDVDGDGVDDLVAGAPGQYFSSFVSSAYVVLGGPRTGTASIRDEGTRLAGGAADDGTGVDVAVVPDSDGDGLPEVAVGADLSGRAWLCDGPWGPATTLDVATAAAAEIRADVDSVLFGRTVGGADVDGDGRGDLVVADPYWAGDAGRLWVFAGPVASATPDEAAATVDMGIGRQGGASVAAADLDGDGAAELAVGVAADASAWGRAVLFRGPVSGTVSIAGGFLQIEGASPSAAVRALAFGDVDGDGEPDLAVGAFGYSVVEDGAVYVFSDLLP